MSYQSVVIELLEGIADARIRSDVWSTIYLLASAYIDGKMSDKELKIALTELTVEVLTEKHPFESPQKIREMAEPIANKLFRAIKIQAMYSRFSRSAGTTPPTSPTSELEFKIE